MSSEPTGVVPTAPAAHGRADHAVEARDVAKVYELGETASLARTLRALSPARRAEHRERNRYPVLRDVSFRIEWGERFAFLGVNGSGKSTLSSIIAGITPPTAGRLVVPERIVALFNVERSGLHPELTGRENILQLGAIFGIPSEVVRERLEAILDLAGLDPRHLDTPVKRFSSGMRARISLGAALHFPADLYIFDEVLAFADDSFKRRCLEEMDALLDRGAAVIFIGHELPLVRQSCQRGLWLHGGRVVAQGPIDEVADRYAASDVGRAELRRQAAERDLRAAELQAGG